MISLKELREQNKLPQKYIADLLELSVTGYAGKESGYRQFNPHEAIKLSDFLLLMFGKYLIIYLMI